MAVDIGTLNMTNEIGRRNEARRLESRLAFADAARELLEPFAREGLKWVTTEGHDALPLLCGEEWALMNRGAREAAFTVGDLKRAALALFPDESRALLATLVTPADREG